MPDDARHHDQRVIADVAREGVGDAPLVAQVQRARQRGLELGEQRARPVARKPCHARQFVRPAPRLGEVDGDV
jgi:hypothetical protein